MANNKSLYFNNYCKIISCLRRYFNFKDKKFFILQCFIFYIVIIQNICLYNKKDSFLQKAKWVFKKGFLQDIRHDLWEILSG